jgi:hypothetical protein
VKITTGFATLALSLATAVTGLGMSLPAQAQQAKPAAPAKAAPAKAPAKAPPKKKVLPPPTTPEQRAALPDADDAQKAASELVFYGKYVCDDKYEIFVEKNKASPFYVDVRYQKMAWVMKPVASNTGAVRLEDIKSQTLLVQIPYKSMLLNTTTGQRIVDSCKHDEQFKAIKEDEEAAKSAPADKPAGLMK